MRFEWVLDEHNTLNCRFKGPDGQDVWLFIDSRPTYCDRGHWKFCVMYGIPHIDAQDSFPRYYMNLAMALQEATSWAVWRLWKVSDSARGLPALKFFDNFTIDIDLPERPCDESSN